MSTEKLKTYSNDEITVNWNASACIHSQKCWRGLMDVFNPKKRPWINLEGANTEEIKRQIDQCPSGALSWSANQQTEAESDEDSGMVKIEVIQNGPLRVHGNVEIQSPDSTIERKSKVIALCRCGMSNNKPYCDGTHKKENWVS